MAVGCQGGRVSTPRPAPRLPPGQVNAPGPAGAQGAGGLDPAARTTSGVGVPGLLPVMSGPLRPGPSNWRRAATLVLAAGWTSPPPPPPARAEGFQLLLLQRAPSQGFMPGAHVFPGGVLDAADRSSDWLRLFAPHHGPPRFGLGPAPPPRATFPVLPDVLSGDGGDAAALPDDVAFRICAIRETFEEAGVLLLRPRGVLPAERRPRPALDPPPGLADWRARVRRDPRHFLSLCAHLDCTPDIWALHEWSNWLTPFVRRPGRRFDTAFYLCCLPGPPRSLPDQAEVVGCQWLSPSDAINSFASKEIWLPPPQFYEIRRLESFSSLSDLHNFCVDRALEGIERFLPITLLTANGMVQLYPGDELYLEDHRFLEDSMSTEKKIEEVMKEGEKFHRLVIHNQHLYSIYVTVRAKYKHIYPKNYNVSKSHL